MQFSADTILRSLTDQNCLLLNRLWRLLISSVFNKSAGDDYWSEMLSTNPLCSLQIRCVIYQSAVVNYWSVEKIKMLKIDPKQVPSQKFFLLVIYVQWPDFLWKNNLSLHNSFKINDYSQLGRGSHKKNSSLNGWAINP